MGKAERERKQREKCVSRNSNTKVENELQQGFYAQTPVSKNVTSFGSRRPTCVDMLQAVDEQCVIKTARFVSAEIIKSFHCSLVC